MKTHELKPAAGARTKPTRPGRGDGSGRGKTAGRGTKGTKARGKIKAFFEGGQMPLVRRIPQLKGFKRPERRAYLPVNLADLERFEGPEVGPEEFRRVGLLSRRVARVKVLGDGDVTSALTVRAHAFSAAAREKIEAAGGTAVVIEGENGGGR